MTDTKLYKDKCENISEEENINADLAIIDPPYNTIQGLEEKIEHWEDSDTEWDNRVPPSQIFNVAKKVLRHNARLIIFTQEPFTSELIQSSPTCFKFNYKAIWVKNNFGNPLSASNSLVKRHENILFFTKVHDTKNEHPLRDYFCKVKNHINLPKSKIYEDMGNQSADHCLRTDSTQFKLCTEDCYTTMTDLYNLDELEDFKTYSKLEEIDDNYQDSHPVVFNLPEDELSIDTIFEYDIPTSSYHLTQKPVPLLEKLVNIYSNENDTVIDFFAGSGSTGVAAVEKNRGFVGVEPIDRYFETMKNRLD